MTTREKLFNGCCTNHDTTCDRIPCYQVSDYLLELEENLISYINSKLINIDTGLYYSSSDWGKNEAYLDIKNKIKEELWKKEVQKK